MFSLSPVGYVFTGEGSMYGIEQLDSIVNHVGAILCYKMNRLFEDRDYCITYFRGLSSEYLAKSVGFEIKSEFLAQSIGVVRFDVRSSEDFPGSFDLKIRVGRLGDNSKVSDFSTSQGIAKHREIARSVLFDNKVKRTDFCDKSSVPNWCHDLILKQQTTDNKEVGDSDHVVPSAAIEYLAIRGVCCL